MQPLSPARVTLLGPPIPICFLYLTHACLLQLGRYRCRRVIENNSADTYCTLVRSPSSQSLLYTTLQHARPHNCLGPRGLSRRFGDGHYRRAASNKRLQHPYLGTENSQCPERLSRRGLDTASRRYPYTPHRATRQRCRALPALLRWFPWELCHRWVFKSRAKCKRSPRWHPRTHLSVGFRA